MHDQQITEKVTEIATLYDKIHKLRDNEDLIHVPIRPAIHIETRLLKAKMGRISKLRSRK